MEDQVRNELNILRDIIMNTIPVERIYLFGSYAGGTPHGESDLDLFVVMSDHANIREIDAVRMIRRAIRDIKTMPVDVIVSTKQKFNEMKSAPTIQRQISQEGVVLYE